jgi:uncharacterized protein YndB with AHSA1/START domain
VIDAEVTRPSGREVVFSRLIAAPVERVWEAWCDVRHLHEWFGPAGFTTTTQEFAFAPGGVWRFTMHGPDGTDYPNRIVFRAIEPNTRIEYANSWDLPGAPLDFTVVVTFAVEGEGTRLILHMTFANDTAMQTAVERYGVLTGGRETFERIAEYVRWLRARLGSAATLE